MTRSGYRCGPRREGLSVTLLEGELAELYAKHGQHNDPWSYHRNFPSTFTWQKAEATVEFGYFVANFGGVIHCLCNNDGEPVQYLGVDFTVVVFSARKTELVWNCTGLKFKSNTIAYSWCLKNKVPNHCRSDWKKGHIKRELCWDIESEVKIIKPLIDLKPDSEYNAITGNHIEPEVIIVPNTTGKTYPKGCSVEDPIYKIFEKHLDKYFDDVSKLPIPTKWGTKSRSIGTHETLPGEEIFLRLAKNEIPFQYAVKCLKLNGFAPLVTRFAKIGHYNSRGETRSIYPMNILYECFLRLVFRGEFVSRYNIAKGRAYIHYGHLYDISKCDYRVLPYIARYAKERGKEWLIPYCNIPDWQLDGWTYIQDQFPSGVYHTTLINTVFVSSLLEHLGVQNACIQGDGFSCDKVLQHEWIRECDDFNGFMLKDGIWCYQRSHRLNEFKYIRGNGPSGKARYHILRYAYRYLGANVGVITNPNSLCNIYDRSVDFYGKCSGCGVPCAGKYHIWEINDDREVAKAISRCYNNVGRVPKIFLDEVGIGKELYDTRTNSWNCVPTKVVVERKGRENLWFPRMQVEF